MHPSDLLDLDIRKIWDAFLNSPQLWRKGVQALGWLRWNDSWPTIFYHINYANGQKGGYYKLKSKSDHEFFQVLKSKSGHSYFLQFLALSYVLSRNRLNSNIWHHYLIIIINNFPMTCQSLQYNMIYIF